MDMELILTTAVTLFIVLDPFGNLAVFHNVLSGVPEEDRGRILLREMFIALIVLMLFLFWGRPLLNFLGLQTHTLQITSGVILFIISIGMIFPTKAVIGHDGDDEPFIVPLAIPLTAGPSAIILLLLLASQKPDHMLEVAAATFLAWLASAVILMTSPLLMRFLGRKGSRALERLMGMLLVMIAIQMFLDGVAGYQHLQ